MLVFYAFTCSVSKTSKPVPKSSLWFGLFLIQMPFPECSCPGPGLNAIRNLESGRGCRVSSQTMGRCCGVDSDIVGRAQHWGQEEQGGWQATRSDLEPRKQMEMRHEVRVDPWSF